MKQAYFAGHVTPQSANLLSQQSNILQAFALFSNTNFFFFRSLTYRVPSAFQLTLYGFCSKSLMFCLSMETGCAPGNPDLNKDDCVTIMAGIHTKQHMS